MEISKSKLKQIIKEELQNFTITEEQLGDDDVTAINALIKAAGSDPTRIAQLASIASNRVSPKN